MKAILGQLLNGRYLVVRQLEQKSSHTTYLAEDQYKLEQDKCLVKQYRLSNLIKVNNFQANKNFKNFLFREVQKVRQFDQHPQVAAILDYFLWGEEFYLVREFIVGKTLKQEIAEGKLEEPQVINLLQETLAILETIHQEKVLHLNLKPANIIFTNDQNNIAIADLARIDSLLQDKVSNSDIITAKSSFDHYYLAPEQKAGKPQVSTDFYALGAIAIQALTGKYLHEVQLCDLDNYARASIVEIETGKITNISSQLAKVLQNLTSFNPNARYQSTQEILHALKHSENVVLLPSPYAFTVHYDQEDSPKATKNKQRKPFNLKLLHLIFGGLTALLLALIGFIFMRNTSANSYKNFAEYNNSHYNISLKYPETWTVRELEDPITGEIAVFTSPLENPLDLFQEQVYLSIDNLSLTPKEYQKNLLNKIADSSQVTEISQKKESIKLADQSVNSITYSRKEGDLELKQKEVYTIKDDKVYLITYIAEEKQYSDLLPLVDQIIESFSLNSISK